MGLGDCWKFSKHTEADLSKVLSKALNWSKLYSLAHFGKISKSCGSMTAPPICPSISVPTTYSEFAKPCNDRCPAQHVT